MGKKIGKKILWIISISILICGTNPAKASQASPKNFQYESVNKVRAVQADSLNMVEEAISVLSQGWSSMSPEEHQLFLRYYDPGNTGEVDEAFVLELLGNYHKIQERLIRQIEFVPQPNSSRCVMMTLYYTDFSKVYICPYILEETNHQRIARDLVHEVAHMAMVLFDRPYYYPNYSEYQKLTPRGHWSGRLPIIGPILREILRQDTLYHPDAYSKYAVDLVTTAEVDSTSVNTAEENALDRKVIIKSDVGNCDQKMLSFANTSP